ncbi:MAG: GNAT family protein [Akkermansia sp.]|nr:GNAT family protein [Akkermansia sp.]
MILSSERLVLRPIEERDLESIRELINNPVVEDTVVGWVLPLSSKDELDWFRGYHNSNKEIRFVIETRQGDLAGLTGLASMDWKNGVCKTAGIRIAPGLQNMGYASEAYCLMLDYAFNQLRFHRVTDGVLVRNAASRRFLEKVGFVQEGVLREHVYKNGRYEDVVAVAILDRDFNMRWHADSAHP